MEENVLAMAAEGDKSRELLHYVLEGQTPGAEIDFAMRCKEILKIAGFEGVLRSADMVPFAHANPLFFENGAFSRSMFVSVLRRLADAGLFSREKTAFGGRHALDFSVFELTESGKLAFRMLFGAEPAASEKQALLQEFRDLETAYMHKDAEAPLREMGFAKAEGRVPYDFVSMEGEKRCVLFFHPAMRAHFSDTLDKLFEASSEILLLCASEEILHGQAKFGFYRWMQERGGIERFKGRLTAGFLAFDRLIQGKNWDRVSF